MTQRAPTWVQRLVENPFAVEGEELEAARRTLAAHDLPALLARELAAAEPARSVAWTLAVGHHLAIEHIDEPARVLDRRTLPDRLLARLPHRRAGFVRVVMAAARCRRALLRLRGRSAAIARVRRETWAACFGESLVHALELLPVIRDHDVLILGETGTGKEAVAHAVQEGTPGPDDGSPAPRSALNAAAVPETLVASELFGHVKGAFTGATDTRLGRIRTAHGGCFFLDEVGDLDTTVQVKLLRVMETNEVQPLGSDGGHRVDVRYVAATHKELGRMTESGGYRPDLYQRLAGIVIRCPALREHPEDLLEIGIAFVREYLTGPVGDARIVDAENWLRSERAQSYPWPGNVRELQNALRSVMLGLPPHLPVAGAEAEAAAPGPELPPRIARCEATLEEATDWYLKRVLGRTGGNYAQAARLLAVDRSTVRRRAGR